MWNKENRRHSSAAPGCLVIIFLTSLHWNSVLYSLDTFVIRGVPPGAARSAARCPSFDFCSDTRCSCVRTSHRLPILGTSVQLLSSVSRSALGTCWDSTLKRFSSDGQLWVLMCTLLMGYLSSPSLVLFHHVGGRLLKYVADKIQREGCFPVFFSPFWLSPKERAISLCPVQIWLAEMVPVIICQPAHPWCLQPALFQVHGNH